MSGDRKRRRGGDGAQWEFDNAKHSSPGHWCPFRPEDNERLESAFAARSKKLWLTIDVFDYVVDFDCMTQHNTRTDRERSIRRVVSDEMQRLRVQRDSLAAQVSRFRNKFRNASKAGRKAKARVSLLNDKLAYLTNAFSTSQTEVSRLKEELQQASIKCSAALSCSQTLSCEVSRLKSQAVATESKLSEETAKNAGTLKEMSEITTFYLAQISAWRDSDSSVAHVIPSSDKRLNEVVQTMLRQAAHNTYSSPCLDMRNATVAFIRPVINRGLWMKYAEKKRTLQEKFKSVWASRVCCLALALPHVPLDERVNEAIVFHGTIHENVHSICESGFDTRAASSQCRYGEGTYFSTHSCKAHQYTDKNKDGLRCIILTRVLLGEPLYATKPMQGTQTLPSFAHSVVAEVRHTEGGQQHREFVLFDRDQCYPELLIYFSS